MTKGLRLPLPTTRTRCPRPPPIPLLPPLPTFRRPLPQSVDRAYRLGQTRDVVVYRLISCGTVEEKIYRWGKMQCD